MNELLESWDGLPTWAKVGVGVGAAALIIFIATRKTSSSSQTVGGIVQPSDSAGIPYGTPLGGGSSDNSGGGYGGSLQNVGGGSGAPVGGSGASVGSQTPAPVGQWTTPSSAATQTVPPASAHIFSNAGIQGVAGVQAINAYTSTTNWKNITQNDQQMLHADKTAIVQSLGYSNDSWGQVRDNTGNINTNLSAKFSSIDALNQYVNENKSSLSSADFNNLHAQKVALAASQGWTVNSIGSVFDSSGKAVGQNGRG